MREDRFGGATETSGDDHAGFELLRGGSAGEARDQSVDGGADNDGEKESAEESRLAVLADGVDSSLRHGVFSMSADTGTERSPVARHLVTLARKTVGAKPCWLNYENAETLCISKGF